MSGEPLVSYADVVAELRRLCTERRTGGLFIVTASNHSGCFVIRNGAIIAVRFQLKRGVDAIQEIAKIESARYTFRDQHTEPESPTPLPPTEELLKVLAGAPAGAPSPSQSPPR